MSGANFLSTFNLVELTVCVPGDTSQGLPL